MYKNSMYKKDAWVRLFLVDDGVSKICNGFFISQKLPKIIQKLFIRSQQLSTIKDNSRSQITQIKQIF